MKEIFKYIDFRVFLADFYTEKKATTRYFSYRYFADKAGIKSPVFLKQVIDGERNLTRSMIEKFIRALNLNKKESVFFKNLVLFNQAKNAFEKQEHYSVMLTMTDYVQEYQLQSDQYSYFDKWYTCVVRELVCIHDFKDDYGAIARSITPRIKASEVKKALQLLLRLKLLEKQQDGSYRQTNAAITSSEEVIALARRSFNSAMLTLARDANDALRPDIRNVSGITMGISRPCYEVLLAEMAAFKERVKAIVNQDENSSRVYQLNLQLFPLSDDVTVLNEGRKGGAPCES